MERYRLSIVWLRRDLRLDDNMALLEACRQSRAVVAAVVVDPALLASDRMGAPLVAVFFAAFIALRDELRRLGGDLALSRGSPEVELAGLVRRFDADALFFNEDYEPAALARDNAVTTALRTAGTAVHAALDHVYFGADEIATAAGTPYRVFTPYRRAWLEHRAEAPRLPAPSRDGLRGKLLPRGDMGESAAIPAPEDYGFAGSPAYPHLSERIARVRLDAFLAPDGPIERYRELRDVPAIDGTSLLSPHLRAGTIGIRTCVEGAFARRQHYTGAARAGIESWIGELIWREFYQMILKRFPNVANGPFRESGRHIAWREDPAGFDAWTAGATGYPIVDAAMRQLNRDGWLHNRLRMIVASFLAKHLLIDWRRGERYFETHLIDADLAQNNGGWQWAASTGTDAVPYFRIFNPTLQSRKFDPDGTFIRRMLPELAGIPAPFIHEPWGVAATSYPAPIVDHEFARGRALAAFAPR